MTYLERSHSPAATRNRQHEHQVFMANKRINDLIEETRRTFGPGAIHSAQINDARQYLFAAGGLAGLHQLIRMFEQCLRQGVKPAMDFWTDED